MKERTYDLKNAIKIWMEVTTRKIPKSEAKKYIKNICKMTLMQQKEKEIMTLENIISWIFSIIQAQYLLVLICTTKIALKHNFWKKSHRENKFKKRKI